MIPETISVIIPVYKVEKYLNQCIASVVNQTYQYLEILLIDDGSPDQCGMICDRWAEKDQRIRVVHKENGGLSDARNAGLRIASGTYIAFVDSDDIIVPTMMEKLLTTLKRENADIVECNYTCFTNELFIKENSVYNKSVGYEVKEAMFLLLNEHTFKYTVWNKLYYKKLFHSLQFEVGKLHEDVFFTYQAFGLCKKIAKIEEALYYYRQRSDSIMGSEFSMRNLDSLEARKRQYFYIKENFPELSAKAQSQVLGNCLYLGQKVFRSSNSNIKEDAIQCIRTIFDEIYVTQAIQENKKQKIWYYMAWKNFRMCCSIRNRLKIGL